MTMLIDENYARRIFSERPDLADKFMKKLEKKYSGHAQVILEDQKKTEKLFRYWLVTSEIL